MKYVSTITRAFLLASAVVLVQPQTVWSKDDGKQKDKPGRMSSAVPKSLNEELATLRAKVAQLEAALKKKHQGQKQSSIIKGKSNLAVRSKDLSGSTRKGMARQSAATKATPTKKGMKAKGSMGGGMKRMKAGKKMGMGMKTSKGKMRGMTFGKKKRMAMMGGNGMGMMGRMPKMAKMSMPSALPGFPGASHIYHIGSTGFYLDHGQHITLSQEQTTKLNRQKEKTLLNQATYTRKIEEAEQALWVLTGAAEPDATKIDAQVRAIAKLQGERRIAFIRAIGNAAKVLTDTQRKKLVGQRGKELDASGKSSIETTTTNSQE